MIDRKYWLKPILVFNLCQQQMDAYVNLVLKNFLPVAKITF